MTFRRAGDAGRLQLRIMSYADSVDAMLLIGGPAPTQWLYDDRLRLNGREALPRRRTGFARGTAQRRLFRRSRQSRPADAFRHAAAQPDEPRCAGQFPGRRPRHRRCRQCRGARRDRGTVARLYRRPALAYRTRADRRSGRPFALWRARHHRLDAARAPDQRHDDGRGAAGCQSRLGGAYAWRSILEAGGTLAFGTDAPVEPVDPLAGLAVAISRTDAAGEPFGGWRPEETINREQALAAYTAGAAYAGFAEGRFGCTGRRRTRRFRHARAPIR